MPRIIKKSIVTKVIELEQAKRERERLDQHIADLQEAINPSCILQIC